MQTIPNSTLYLCKNVDLDPNYNYTIDFDNITAQANYFDSKIASEFEINEGYSYIRDTQTLKVQANIDDLLGINYLFYNNGSKRYYAFITKKDYINPTCTSLTFKIDVLQSFMFNYEIDESFIEREHQDRFTTDLKPIFNQKSENVEYGNNYILKSNTNVIQKMVNHIDIKIKYFLIISSDKLGTETEDVPHIDGYDPLYYYLVPICVEEGKGVNFYFKYINGSEVTTTRLTTPLTMFQKLSKIKPSILSIKLLDYSPINYLVTKENLTITFFGRGRISTIKSSETQDIDYNLINITSEDLLTDVNDDSRREINTINLNFDFNLDINNLKDIKNEPKLLISPYHFYKLSNNNGNELDINIVGLENYKEIQIYHIPNITPLSKELYYIKNYYNDKLGLFYNLVDNNVNEMPLANDKWIDYLSQNKASATAGVAVNLGASALTTAIGAFTANPLAIAGGVLSFGQSVANTILKQQDIKKSPDTARNLGNNASFNLARQLPSLQLEEFEIEENFKTTLFNYFYHYGYKCNDFKKPNTRSRYYFNYIKTIGANIKTEIDADFRAEIANIFNNGITIWHYRTAGTFKGINNYDYENVETNLMED